ncbi:MAG: BatA domain-containing protein [Abditibacteriales bacterium]|nr:BatA domain-containing protein [Abditibacteriales bacterium]MDW8366328.1 BatA domain-containing protein [Abditibacteriales bacterium]
MFGISFLNPALLSALGLGTIPIIIHLLQRRRFRVIPWAAMEFLLLSQKQNRRRLQLEHLLLLLVRVLVLVLFALALARPAIQTSTLPAFAGGRRPHAVIVLDNSYSMGVRVGGTTLFERAKQVAVDIVTKQLKQGDAVSFVLASDRPTAVIAEPTYDLAQAAALIRRAPLSDFGTDFHKTARLCTDLLRRVKNPNREVYLITDNQRVGWERGTKETTQPSNHLPTQTLWRDLSRLARLNLIPLAAPSTDNVVVEGVDIVRGIVSTRAPTRMRARIRNLSSRPLPHVMVTLWEGDTPAESIRVSLPPNGTATAQFAHLFTRIGAQGGAVRVRADDVLPRDDAAYFAVRVVDRARVLCVNGQPHSDPAKDEVFYLVTALSPPAESAQEEKAVIAPEVTPLYFPPYQAGTGGRLQNYNLHDYDTVILANVARLSDEDRDALRQYVQSGGGVLVFLGSAVDVRHYNETLYQNGQGLLPAPLTDVRVGRSAEEFVTLDAASINHPALQLFKDAADVEIQSARFYKYFGFRIPDFGAKGVQSAVRVLCRFSDGSPALVEKSVGLGKVVVCASTADAEWNNLPYKPAYLPLLHELVAYLRQGAEGRRNVTVGEPLLRTLSVKDAGREARVIAPDGRTATIRATLDRRGCTLTFPQTDRAGIWRMQAEQTGTPRPSIAECFAVNLRTTESDLTPLHPSALRRLIPEARFHVIDNPDNLRAAIQKSRLGIELWRHLIGAAIVLLLMEVWLAQKFGRRGE